MNSCSLENQMVGTHSSPNFELKMRLGWSQ